MVDGYSDIFLHFATIFRDFVLLTEDAQKLIQVGFVSVLDTEVVDDQGEGEVLGAVAEQSRGVRTLDVVIFCEVLDQSVLR